LERNECKRKIGKKRAQPEGGIKGKSSRQKQLGIKYRRGISINQAGGAEGKNPRTKEAATTKETTKVFLFKHVGIARSVR